jgi:hypothetical protein
MKNSFTGVLGLLLYSRASYRSIFSSFYRRFYIGKRLIGLWLVVFIGAF